MDEEIDFSAYVTPTRFSHAEGIVLVIQLLRAAPLTPTALVRKALERLRDAAVAGQALELEELRDSPELIKPIDVRLDGGIVGLREVLEAKQRLTGTEIAERATKLLRKVFPRGTRFVLLGLREQWTAVRSHLDRIDADGLAAEIDAVADPAFLPFIRAAHDELGEALGVGETALTASETESKRASTLRMAKAIAAYGRALVGTVDEDEPATLEAFKKAMYPLDVYRSTAFPRRATGGETDVETDVDPNLNGDTDVRPTDPIPPVPPSDPLG